MGDPLRCAILGATGLVGAALLDAALAADRYGTVRALVRREVERKHARLEESVVDFERLVAAPTDAGAVASFAVDHVFCCLGTTLAKAGSREAFRRVDRDYPLAAARAAHAAGAARFLIITAVGSDTSSSFFYNRVKGELEDELRALAFPDGVTVFHPSMLLGARAERRPVEAAAGAVMRATRGLFAGALTRYRPIEASELARAMLRAAEQPQTEAFRVVEGRELFALAAGPGA